MPLYEFQCEKGHSTDRFYRMSDTRPSSIECPTCHEPAARRFGGASVIPDFPEHFNVSIGEVVKNRAHLRQIQKERGLQDYEPTRNSPGAELVNHRLRKGA